jgi:tRNA-binding EMAP/Myf-like protein
MKFAVIGKINKVTEIIGADKIQSVEVVCGDAGKWNGVCAKNLKEGDRVTVFLQDALLPPDPRWAFMEPRKWIVRMCRFMKVPSECLILEGAPDGKVGTDLTELLGVTKYSKPIPAGMGGDAVGAFPSFIPKTDEPNYQTIDWQALMDNSAWYASEKADGTSCTVWNDDGLHVASRNWELREYTASGAANLYWETAKKYDWTKLPEGVAAQFEIIGGKVQGNPMGVANGMEGRLFTLYDYANHKRVGKIELDKLAAEIGIKTAPIIFANGVVPTLEKLREISAIKYQNGKSGEGVVIRDYDNTWSFKVINLDYKG